MYSRSCYERYEAQLGTGQHGYALNSTVLGWSKLPRITVLPTYIHPPLIAPNLTCIFKVNLDSP